MSYIVVDLEATCCDDDSFPKSEMEIIEIGAVKLDANYEVIDEFERFVYPVINHNLTEFCKNLTTIRQEEVDTAFRFVRVFNDFQDWIGEGRHWLCSWGYYDVNQFRKDCERFPTLEFPEWFETRHKNIKQLFADKQQCKPCGIPKALDMLGESFEGTLHRGIDDARNIARVMRRLCL